MADRGRLQRGGVRPGSFLGQRVAAEGATARQPRQPALALRFRAMRLDLLGGNMDVHAVRIDIGDVGARHFLDGKAVASKSSPSPP
jgi:hypothetical protein